MSAIVIAFTPKLSKGVKMPNNEKFASESGSSGRGSRLLNDCEKTYAMEASDEVRITEKQVQPKRNAKKRLYIFLKYTYSPPASASILATSALLRAPKMVMIPASTQQSNTRSADPNSADMGATFLYIPEPITELTVMIKVANRPSDLTSCPWVGFSCIAQNR